MGSWNRTIFDDDGDDEIDVDLGSLLSICEIFLRLTMSPAVFLAFALGRALRSLGSAAPVSRIALKALETLMASHTVGEDGMGLGLAVLVGRCHRLACTQPM